MDEVGSEDFVLVMERERTLLEAVIDENVALVSDILQKGGHDVNEPDKNGRTLIFWCVNRGNSDLTDVLLQNGADVRIVDIHDNTPLHWCGNIEILHMLIAYGADILAKFVFFLISSRQVEQSIIRYFKAILQVWIYKAFTWAPLTCSEWGGSEKFKMKIYVSSGTRTHNTPVHDWQ